ncbi:hypothetical protein ACIRQP_08650 [Streptomyces sp. NPDC102274]|uniref:hypothetical protein n=1 Tax=Streptomyces sp. NPDC102274 TaxID=3366151 RepID=UPI00380D6FC2
MKTISLSEPVGGTIQSAEATVTFLPSAELTVTGSRGVGVAASGSTRSAAAVGGGFRFASAAFVPSPPQPVAVRARAGTERRAPVRRGLRTERTILFVLSSCSVGASVG